MKSFQDRLFKDFDVKKETGKNGRTRRVYTYVGDYAAWNIPDEKLKKTKSLYAGGGIAIALLYIWKSLQGVPLNSSGIVGAITLLSLAALIALAIGIWQFVMSKKEMYLRDCKETKTLVTAGSMAYFILQLGGCVAGIVFLILEGASFLSILVVIAGVVSAFLAYVIFSSQVRISYLEIPNKNRKKE